MLDEVNPRQIRLEASSHCQLKCPSCPTTTGAIQAGVGSGFLKFKDFQQIVDQNPQLRVIELSNYGEILLNPDFIKMLEYANIKNVSLDAKNGVNLNHVRHQVLEGLVKFKFRSLTVSIDGASAESYPIYRVRGNFERVLQHIRTLNDYKKQYQSEFPRLFWQFVVYGHNEHEIPRARELAEELGMTLWLKLSWDDQFSPIKDIQFVRKEVGLGVVTRAEFEKRFGLDYSHKICNQLWDEPQINWDGRVLGCCRNFWSDFGSNAFTHGLKTAVNSERMIYARQMLLGKKPSRADIPCATCGIYEKMVARKKFLNRSAFYQRWIDRWIRLRGRLANAYTQSGRGRKNGR